LEVYRTLCRFQGLLALPTTLPSPHDAPQPAAAAAADRHPGADAAAPPPAAVRVSFRLQYHTPPGAAVRICGDDPILGAWLPGAALPMQRCGGGDDWVAHADLAAG
jgi:hypothetical protein